VNGAEETPPTLATLRHAREQQQAVQRWLNSAGPFLLIFVFVATAYRAHPRLGLTGQGLVVTVALCGFAVGVLGARGMNRSSRLTYIAWALLVGASSVVLMVAQPSGPGSVGVLFGVLMVARRLPGRAGVPLSVAAFLILAVIDAIARQGAGVALLGAFGAFYGMFLLSGRLGVTNAQAERLLIELDQSREAEARAARLAERQRLAREMHDVLAHSLSGLMIQLDGARILAAEAPGDPRLPEVIDRAHRLGRSGLEEARRAIGLLRDEELPGPERLPALVSEFEADQGIPCALTVSGEPQELGSEARLAVYRVAQEALTNITKHAHAARVELALAYQPTATRLTVEDFAAANRAGGALAGDLGSGGYGLTGMRERAELLGGSLSADTTDAGFRVELEVPR
jgi:signal transduction histidine kinase